MSARLIDGKAVAAETSAFTQRTGVVPHLAVVLVGEDPASAVSVRNKQMACEKSGLKRHAGMPWWIPALMKRCSRCHWQKCLRENSINSGRARLLASLAIV